MALIDAAQIAHEPAGADARIACLVPSITELLCDLGLAGSLVARTGFCIHPWEVVREIPKVGGTKDVMLERLRELSPTHVIVNIDENTRETAAALAEFVDHVIVTHPLAPADNLELYTLLGGVFGRVAEARGLSERFTRASARLDAAVAGRPTEDVIYLIWRDPWMTVSPDTYISRTLELIGWRTLPRDATERYPELDLTRWAGRVDRVLLSSEPFHFHERHLPEVRELLPGAEVSLIDGELISWYGSRAIAGLDYLAGLRADAEWRQSA